jgi:release factor glutamine methyltransferase
MLALSEWLQAATQHLKKAGIASARLDAELILAHTIHKNRTYIHAHPEVQLEARLKEITDARIEIRADRTPLAYIIGHKEFYGRRFRVTPATLIPRPESEAIIELLKRFLPFVPALEPQRLVDVGTGTGCLGITAKLELPELEVTLLDTSRHALDVAEKNARQLHAQISLRQSDLLKNYPLTVSVILANLPYVDEAWERSPETNAEPPQALFAGNHGLALIERLLHEAPSHLISGGLLLLEAGPRQHAGILTMANGTGFSHLATEGFILGLQKN